MVSRVSPVVEVALSAKVSVTPPVTMGVVGSGWAGPSRPVGPPTALASAAAPASVSLAADTVTVPSRAIKVTPSLTLAVDSETPTFTASAAPRLMSPLLLVADGASGRLELGTSSRPVARSKFSPTCSSAVGWGSGLFGSAGGCAPRALAVAVADESDSVWAWISTSPDSAVTSRPSSAVASSTSTVRPTPMPKPALLPAASAAATLVAEPLCMALSVRPPSNSRA